MIEIFDIKKYDMYKNRNGPFCLFFFNQHNGRVTDKENINLIKNIQNLEFEYKDIPLLGFEYNTFKESYSNHVKSCMDILIIQKNEKNILFEKPKFDELRNIFDLVREKLYNIRKAKNKQYNSTYKRLKMRMWVSCGHIKKLDPYLKNENLRNHKQNQLMGIMSDFSINANNKMKMDLISKVKKNPKYKPNLNARKYRLDKIEKSRYRDEIFLYNNPYNSNHIIYSKSENNHEFGGRFKNESHNIKNLIKPKFLKSTVKKSHTLTSKFSFDKLLKHRDLTNEDFHLPGKISIMQKAIRQKEN